MSGGLRKRSVTLAGHRTSLSLEDAFWQLLQEEAERSGRSMTGLIAEIDRARSGEPEPLNLSSAVRVWLVTRLRDRLD